MRKLLFVLLGACALSGPAMAQDLTREQAIGLTAMLATYSQACPNADMVGAKQAGEFYGSLIGQIDTATLAAMRLALVNQNAHMMVDKITWCNEVTKAIAK
jgi:hypothetical protein